MRVAFNGMLLERDRTGIARYAKNMLFHLRECMPASDLQVVVTKQQASTAGEFWQGFNLIEVDAQKPYLLWEQLDLPLILAEQAVDVYHSPLYVAPIRSGTKTVVTVHGLGMFRYAHKQTRTYDRKWVLIGAHAADKIIVPSRYTAQEAIRLLRVSPEKVHVIYEGPDPHIRFMERTERVRLLEQVSLVGRRYFFYAGMLDESKNVDGVLRLFAEYEKRDGGCLLVIAGGINDESGGRSRRYEDLRRLARELGVDDTVRFVGHMEDEMLSALYSGCEAFIFLSLYEGFGLPLVEAMQCRAPVLAAKRSCIPEVTGGAAVLCDPEKPEECALLLERIVRSEPYREEMVNRGLRRAQELSWEKATLSTVALYKELCQ